MVAIASYKSIDNKTTKFRGLEPTNPQGKTSKQLTLQKLEEKTQYEHTTVYSYNNNQ